MSGHRFAREIRIVRNGAGQPASMFIDGELFPYFTADGFDIHPRRGEVPSVSLVLMAERVEVTDSIDAAGDDAGGPA